MLLHLSEVGCVHCESAPPAIVGKLSINTRRVRAPRSISAGLSRKTAPSITTVDRICPAHGEYSEDHASRVANWSSGCPNHEREEESEQETHLGL